MFLLGMFLGLLLGSISYGVYIFYRIDHLDSDPAIKQRLSIAITRVLKEHSDFARSHDSSTVPSPKM